MNQSQGGNPFGRLMELARPHKMGYVVSVVLAVLGVAFGIVPYFATARMTIALLSGNRDVSFYMGWCLLSGSCFVLKAILMGISTGASHEATFEVLSEARRESASKLTRVPMGYILNTPSGQLKNGMVERIEQLEVPLAHVVPEMTSNLLVPAAILVYLFLLDWRMALISLITIPVGMLCYLGMMKEYPKKYGEVVKAGNHMSAVTVEYIGGIEVIKAFNQAEHSYQRFTDAVHANANLILDWMKDTQKYSAVMMSVWPAALISVLPVGCLFYRNSSLSAATFITVTVLSLGIAGPLVAAMFFTDDIAKIGTVMGEIDGILNQPELVRPEGKCDLRNFDISLEKVHFAYGEKEVLTGVDLAIPQGKMTALVGPSGSGKSTIAKLIASFWDVTGGLITIGDKSVKEISADQLNDLISYVSQDNYLFNDTVRNNIRMGKPGASDAEVEQIARASGCHEFILNLEHGYETVVGGAGGHLSGGERQRIVIARAILKNTPIVILDEASSYMDPENEAVIQDALSRLTKGKTLIVIAHRLSTVTEADQIVVVKDGKIFAKGTHGELLKECSLYHSMWTAHIGAGEVKPA
ncbi:MAG: ABC transporter ATP-binding protein [Eubacteriales bacterium]|nr:ABC transporter ATP-binding protein [Eubacteriales bacterium]